MGFQIFCDVTNYPYKPHLFDWVAMELLKKKSALTQNYVYVTYDSLNLLFPQLLLNNFQPALSLALLTETECAVWASLSNSSPVIMHAFVFWSTPSRWWGVCTRRVRTTHSGNSRTAPIRSLGCTQSRTLCPWWTLLSCPYRGRTPWKTWTRAPRKSIKDMGWTKHTERFQQTPDLRLFVIHFLPSGVPYGMSKSLKCLQLSRPQRAQVFSHLTFNLAVISPVFLSWCFCLCTGVGLDMS